MTYGALINYINEKLDIGVEYQRVFGRQMPNGKFFCPFHHNTNTPAAKRYFNGIKCFSCDKFYTVYDFLKQFNPRRIDEIAGSAVLPNTNNITFVSNKDKINIVKYDDNDNIKSIIDKILRANGISIQEQ